ncbi:MAG: hypothetical protein ACFE0O_14450 [Opitutales bacterium]
MDNSESHEKSDNAYTDIIRLVKNGEYNERNRYLDRKHLLLFFDSIHFAWTLEESALKKQDLKRPFFVAFPIHQKSILYTCQKAISMIYIDLVRKFVSSFDSRFLNGEEKMVVAYLNHFRVMFDIVEFKNKENIPDVLYELSDIIKSIVNVFPEQSRIHIEATKLLAVMGVVFSE